MAVRGLSGFSRENLLRAENRQIAKQAREEEKIARKNARNEGAEISEIKANPRRRKKIQDELLNRQEPPAPVPVEESAAPKPAEPAADDSLRTLAQQFVQQFESQSGRELSSAERETKITEVYEFYSQPARAGRLESIVFPELATA